MFDQAGNTLAKGNQNGFYDLQGKPRANLISEVTKMNHEVYHHTIQAGTPEELKDLKADLFAKWKKHSIKPKRK